MSKKIFVLGDDFSGKTSLISQWVDGVYSENVSHTSAISFKKASCELENTSFEAKIIDLPESQSVLSPDMSGIMNADGVIIVLDLTNPNSLQSLGKWVHFSRSCNYNLPIVVVGNKMDLMNDIKIRSEDIRAECSKFNAHYFDVSAKTGYCVDDAFGEIMNMVANNNTAPMGQMPPSQSYQNPQQQQQQYQQQQPQAIPQQKPYSTNMNIDEDDGGCCRI